MNDLFIILQGFLKALVFTILIEETVALIFFRRKKYVFVSVLFINTLTNPLVNLLYLLANLYIEVNVYGAIVIIMELVVIIAEWKLLEYTLNKKLYIYLVYSATANALSYFLGLIIF